MPCVVFVNLGIVSGATERLSLGAELNRLVIVVDVVSVDAGSEKILDFEGSLYLTVSHYTVLSCHIACLTIEFLIFGI